MKRDTIVGVLLPLDGGDGPQPAQQAQGQGGAQGQLQLVPLDPRLPRCLVTAESLQQLPEAIK
jgi:hypothetical protein